MINKKIQDSINKQINAEMFSSYLYLAMNAYFEDMGLKGFAHWMKVQAQEEMCHAMIFYNYLNDRGGRVILESIEKPTFEWANPVAVFENVYAHEQYVTSLINDIVSLSMEEKDHATTAALQWFVTEQVEEEDSANDILNRLKLVGSDNSALFMMNDELATRVFALPSPLTGKI